MTTYFIVSKSFAAPLFSHHSEEYHKGSDPEQVLSTFVRLYSHPARLFSAYLYQTSEDYKKGKPCLFKWLSGAAEVQSRGWETYCCSPLELDDKYEGNITKGSSFFS